MTQLVAQLRRFGAPRSFALILALFVLALAVVVFPEQPAAAAPVGEKRAEACSVDEWRIDITGCVDRLADVATARTQCLKAPTPDAPDSGLGGWFATRPEAANASGVAGHYTDYGYAGYAYTTYDIGCAQTLMHPDYKFENTVANGEFMLATAIIGASNALRERAWDPGVMWGWADPLVKQATQSIYTKVFSVFGVVTLAVVGFYLLWRSRQAEMSTALTTAAWALLVMVIVTGLARYPEYSAHFADKTLLTSLGIVHDAVGPPTKNVPPEDCFAENKAACRDFRPPAVRAGDTAVDTMLYRNWLRGMLGSSDSVTAQKYGEALYRAHSFSWKEIQAVRDNPEIREQQILEKNRQFMKVAEQIRLEDPEAYAYLQGTKGMERIGAGFIALLTAAMFALFDLTASVLVLLGFLIFRWAVIAAPIIGTIAILQPASGGFRRLVNAVVAAMFNIVIFGAGAAVYLFAVDLIMNTPTLAGWLQVILVWLCGVVGWLLLRPYRRITQLGGKNATEAVASAGAWHRRFFRDVRETATLAVAKSGSSESTVADRPPLRVEVRAEPPVHAGVVEQTPPNQMPAGSPRRRVPSPATDDWGAPEAEPASGQAVYRSSRSPSTSRAEQPAHVGGRTEAQREY